jgi:hypothetical protein
VYVILNERILVELDLNISDNSYISLLSNGKKKIEDFKTISFEYTKKNKIDYNYSLLINSEDKSAKYLWKFNEKIIKCTQKPSKQPDINMQMALSFSGGYLRLFNLITYIMTFEYKTRYGNIISLEYSEDSNLLGIGTESDEVFILDPNLGKVLYYFEGHRNYITSIVFQEVAEEENEKIEPSTERLDTGENINFSSTNKPYTLSNKEIYLDEFFKLCIDKDEKIDVKQLRRQRTSVKNLNNLQDEIKFSKTYDVFTSGLDGQLAIWRIEYFIDEEKLNSQKSNEINISKILKSPNPTSNSLRYEAPSTIFLLPNESIKVFPSGLTKICKGPVIQLIICQNTIAYYSKRNSLGSYCSLAFFTECTAKENIIDDKLQSTSKSCKKDSLFEEKNSYKTSSTNDNIYKSSANNK